jgi:hypothetical protein
MDVLELWNKFDSVSIGASLDAEGARAELMRKGTKWNDIVENRKRMIKEAPNVDFYISSTVGMVNALHVTDFHRSWVDQGLIKPQDFNFNLLQWPKWQRMDMFPMEYKKRVEEKYLSHIEWLDDQDHLTRAVKGYESAIKWMYDKDTSDTLPLFFDLTRKYDGVREESLVSVFPELKELFDNYEKN